MKKNVETGRTRAGKDIRKSSRVHTDATLIEEILTRGTAAVFPSPEFLRTQLQSGKRLSLYFGIDPTAPTLHVGHVIGLQKMRQFQELGHEIILLIGDFTGMVGDPTDKSATRIRLTRAQVLANAKRYKSQASRIISFTGINPARLAYNGTWHRTLNFEQVLNLAAHVTVDQLLKRDMFVRRMEDGKPIYLHEFLYPLLQGYDSVALKVDGEVGGNDQTFNMLVGRDLMKQISGTEKFVLATRLLEDPSGKKMGKSEGNMVSFSDSPQDVFGKVMSWTDGMIVPAWELCTRTPVSEIESVRRSLERGENPRDQKIKLAHHLVELVHGTVAARAAQEHFTQTFQAREIPKDIPTIVLAADTPLIDGFVLNHIISSKSEFRRLVAQGAVEKDGTRITDPAAPVEVGVFRIGKHRFVRVEVC